MNLAKIPNTKTSLGSKLGPSVAVVASIGLWGVVYYFLEPLSCWATGSIPGLGEWPRLRNAAAFFIYEAPKVLMLLVLIVFVVGVVRSFFSPQRTRRLLSGKKEATGNALASLLGVVTPFCSCSAVPLFIGFLTAGVPLGVTFSFLIAAPMVNEVALVLLFGLFGWKVAALYLGTGLGIAMLAGFVLGKLGLERQVEDWVWKIRAQEGSADEILPWNGRLRAGVAAVGEITGKVWPWVLLGIAVGAFIHGYVPENFLASLMGKSAWYSVPVAVLLGIPMYSNAAGIIPVVHALIEKGASLGTVLAFMMSVIALSLPELILLRKVLKPKLIGFFVGVVATGILLIGYLFNLVL